jgi:hypothetical protein
MILKKEFKRTGLIILSGNGGPLGGRIAVIDIMSE